MPVLDSDIKSESSGNLKSILKNPVALLMLLGLAIVALGRGNIGILQFDAATVYGFGMMALIYFAITSIIGFLHYSRKFLFNGGFFATDGQFEHIPHTNFGAIAMDQFDVPPVHALRKLATGTFVFPLAAKNHLGRNMACMVRGVKVLDEDMPELCRDYLERTGAKRPWMFGFVDPSQYFEPIDDPTLGRVDVAVVSANYQRLIREHNWLSDLLKGKFDTFLQSVDAMKSIIGSAEGRESATEKARRFFSGRKAE